MSNDTYRPKIFGYARVSTTDQHLELQRDALNKYGVDEILEEKISTRKENRPQLELLLTKLRAGDSVIIYKLDRLSRSLKELIKLSDFFSKNNINFISLRENIDTTTASGRFFFTVLAGIAQFERDLISERTKAGLNAARARGRIGGRKKTPEHILKLAYTMWQSKEYSMKQICEQTHICYETIYRYIRKFKQTDNNVISQQNCIPAGEDCNSPSQIA
jgi:DNA invertase Pin-like site-specific DNA recombinase